MADHEGFMRMAIEEAQKSKPEDSRPHPKVGAVVVKDGKLLDKGYRGELSPGEHAEYTVLERKLRNEAVSGATLYTTMEPCTTRSHPKVPCADRLIERKIARVFMGMLDPDPRISGSGQRRLREANVATEFFPTDLMAEVEELNRDYSREQKRAGEGYMADAEFIQKHQGRSLDLWYHVINRVYWNRNFSRDPSVTFAHLVEVIGGVSSLASSKSKPGVDPEAHLGKAIAWWMAMCGKVGVKSVEALIWDKFPGVCPYCHEERHDPDVCSHKKASQPGPLWSALADIGKAKGQPERLGDWQVMFSRIYPAQQTEDYGPSFARLAEELGELAEAVRVFPAEPGYFLSEAADVFAWLMHIQNILDSKRGTPPMERGRALEKTFCRLYPDSCKDCGRATCACPPILQSTIGRIAHDVPLARGGFGESGRFMTPDKASKFFQSAP